MFLLFCFRTLLLNHRREMTERCRFNAQEKGKQMNWDFMPCNASQLWLWFCPFSLGLLPAGWLPCLSPSLFFSGFSRGLNTLSHDDPRHARGCSVQRGLAGGAAPARPAAMHRASSLLHHVPGTAAPPRVGRVVPGATRCCENQLKTSGVQRGEGSAQDRSSHKSVPKDFEREAPEIGERDF